MALAREYVIIITRVGIKLNVGSLKQYIFTFAVHAPRSLLLVANATGRAARGERLADSDRLFLDSGDAGVLRPQAE